MVRALLLLALVSVASAPTARAEPGPPAAAASPPTAEDNIDLSALGLDTNGGGAFDDKINLYGFADFTWANTHLTHATAYAHDTTTFALSNLNLYIAKNLTPRWRSLAEIRFDYVPAGSTNPDGTTMVTTAADVTNFSRATEWGTISIERAYVEYDLTRYLTIRAGHWLTPYGIWNTDHGSPVIIGVFRPYIIGEELFPEHQTGLDLFGTAPVGDYKLSYHATLSNGRSQTEIVADTDRQPAYGGRVELEAPWAGTLKVGASGYAGRSTSALTSTTVAPTAFDERGLAADVRWDHGGLHLQAEAVRRYKIFLDGHRPLTATGTQPDGADLGVYVLAGYRFNRLWNVMPFSFYEDYRPVAPGELGDIKDLNIGLNFRPLPTVVLKLQATYAHSNDAGLIQSNVVLVTSQIAWVF